MDDRPEFTDIAKIMVHDVNNLLAIIMGYFDLALLENDDSPRATKEVLPIARQTAKDINSLVSDFTHIVAIEEKELSLCLEKTDINALISGILKKEAMPMAAAAGVALIGPHENRELYCEVDKNLISKAIINLITSAIKGTPEGGRVEVASGSYGDGVKITMKDTGFPIPPEYREKIFEKRSLGEVSETKLKKRAGLGLVFSRLVVEAHGGKVRVEPEGKENVFIITIPRK